MDDVQRLETGHDDRFVEFRSDFTIGIGAGDSADMRWADKAIHMDLGTVRPRWSLPRRSVPRRSVKDRAHGGRGQHVVAKDREIAQVFAACGADGERRGRRGGFEADREKDDLPVRFGFRDPQRVQRGIDHADIGAGSAGAQQGGAARGRHAYDIRVGAQGNPGAHGELDGVIDAAGGQHTDGAARAVHQLHIGGKQIFEAVTRNGVGVAAAEFHELVVPARFGVMGDFGGDIPRQAAVAVFVHMFHGRASAACSAPMAPASCMRARVMAASSGSSLARA